MDYYRFLDEHVPRYSTVNARGKMDSGHMIKN